ncbi:hypothetical protein AB0N79_33805 [Streptomyces microflavus]|uniref:hypothetical protein n=1 Tax=Streptomyces microflavus TaxID=1919 RepID=UPI00225605D3|nr:hypothetical protein [Streptomyces microflavus]MCX4657438.1 hypothetical protein [Streptomyces microflavus]
MSTTAADYAWLPDHQLHVVATLAHVDQTVERVIRMVHDYTAQEPLSLKTVVDGDQVQAVVTAIAPLPEAIPRLVADALTQLRAALEHTVYAEVQHLLRRSLTAEEARSIEMPATTSLADFEAWLNHRRRRGLAPLQPSDPLAQRIRALQPFQRRDPDEHPLKILVEYTNMAKHRRPTVAAARLAAVHPDAPNPGLSVSQPLERWPQPGSGQPIHVNDTIATAPRRAYIPFSIWTTVSLQRPHTSIWNIAAKELEYLEDWVRTTAIPIIVTGGREVTPLPPQLDISTGHDDLRSELPGAGAASAAERGGQRIQAAVARVGLTEVLAPLMGSDMSETLSEWAATLTDDAVLQRLGRLAQASHSPQESLRATGQMAAEVREFMGRHHESDEG